MLTTRRPVLSCTLALFSGCSGVAGDGLSVGLGNADGSTVSDGGGGDDAGASPPGEEILDASGTGLDGGANGAGDGGLTDGSAPSPEVDESTAMTATDSSMEDADSGPDAGGACCGPAEYDTQVDTTLPNLLNCGTWTLSNNADTELPTLADQKLHISTSADAENMYFGHGAANLSTPGILTIEARMMVLSGTASVVSRAPAVISWVYGANHSKNMLQIAAGEVFLLSAENSKGPAYALDTTSAMRDYKIEVNTTTHATTVTIDGVARLTGSSYTDPAQSPPQILWGEGSIFAHGVSDWQSVRHNAYVCAPAP